MWRELDGVGEQIPAYLLQTGLIAGDATDLSAHHLPEINIFSFRCRADALDGGFNAGGEVDGSHVEPQFAGDDARDVEQVFDEPALGARVALDNLQRVARGPLVQSPAAQEMAPAEH